MSMEREAHEEIINKLLDGELPVSERTELLNQLRGNYNSTLGTLEEVNSTVEKLTLDNSDLIISNSKMFRQLGVVTPKEEEKVVEKELSETIKIEDLGVGE